MRHRSGFIVLLAGLSSLLMASSASALCALSTGPKNPASFEPFADRPDVLLIAYPNGGEGMTNFVVAFVGRERTGLKTVIAALPQGSPRQREAIGLALARAASACQASDGDVTRAIRDAVARSSDASLKRGYLAGLPMDEPSVAGGLPRKTTPRGSFSDLPLSGPLDREGVAGTPADPFAPLL